MSAGAWSVIKYFSMFAIKAETRTKPNTTFDIQLQASWSKKPVKQ